MLVAVQFAGAAVAGLHLIDHEQNVTRLRQFPCGLDVFLRQAVHAALALNGFDQQGAYVAHVQRRLQRVCVVGGHMPESLREGPEIMMERILPRGRQRGEGAAVEAVFQREDDGAHVFAVLEGAVTTRGLDGAFVGLRAGVAEKHALHARALAQALRQERLRRGVVQVAGVGKLPGLRAHRRDPALIPIAQGIHGDAAAHVDIGFAGLVIQMAALAPHKGDGSAGIGMGHILAVQSLNIGHAQ